MNCLENIDIWSPQMLAILIGSGILIGIINTLAGSGTAISYGLFMWLGMPPSFANGSVRIGVVPQTFAAAWNFYRKGKLELRSALLISIPMTVGSVVGAGIAVSINQDLFRIIIGASMVLMLVFIFYKPESWIHGKPGAHDKKIEWWHWLLYFAIGVYGGFIHIGVGIFLLAALVLVSGYDLVRANSLKVFVVLIYTPFALAVFMLSGEVCYIVGLISALGNTLGGIIASNYAVKYGAKPLRWILIAVILVFSAHLFGLFG